MAQPNAMLKAAVALLVVCCACAHGVWAVARPYPFAIDESDDDRPMTFDEQAILFELTAHADAMERGEVAHELSAHTKAWMEQQMWQELRDMANAEQFTRHESSQEVSFEDALRFKQRYMAKRGKRWSPGGWLKRKAKAALGAVVDGAKAVGGAVKAGARWVKNKAKAIWNKYKCPICKFAVDKIAGFLKDKGVEGACKWAAKGICALASVPICGPVAPVCRTVLCPLVNPLLKSGCSKIVNWLVSKLEDKLTFSGEKVCAAIKLCKGPAANLDKGAKTGKHNAKGKDGKEKDEKDDKHKGKEKDGKEAKEAGKGEAEKKAKDKSASGGESGGESGGKHKKSHRRRHHRKGHRSRRHKKHRSGSGGASGGASGGESGGKSSSNSGGAEKKEEKSGSGDSSTSSGSSGSGEGGEKKETITMAKHNEQIQSMQQQIDELKAKLAAQQAGGKTDAKTDGEAKSEAKGEAKSESKESK